MTFLSPVKTVDARLPSILFGRKPARLGGRLRVADEDGARRALGGDASMPTPVWAGTSIEHLARIALG